MIIQSQKNLSRSDRQDFSQFASQPKITTGVSTTEIATDCADREDLLQDEALEATGIDFRRKVFERIFERDLNEASLLRNSRFLHHLTNFRSVRGSVLAFSAPFLLMLLLFLVQFSSETLEVSRFQRIGNDIVLLDSFAYLAWICFLQTQYLTVRRLIMEGLVAEEQFARWGISNMTERIAGIMQLPDLQNQFVRNINRMRKSMTNSSYREYYDLAFVETASADLLTVTEGEDGLRHVRMKAVDGVRYTQMVLNTLLADFEAMHGVWGPGLDESQSKLEAVVRHNNLNPIWSFVARGKPASSSF